MKVSNLPTGKRIIVQSIQPFSFWEKFQSNQFISGDRQIIEAQLCREFQETENDDGYGTFRGSYLWLSNKMRERGIIDLSPNQDAYPIYAWCQELNNKRAISDLRHCKTYIPKGGKGVRITLSLPLNRVMLTDFDLWHCVLNNFSADESLTEEEEDLLDQDGIIKTWDCIIYSNESFLNGRYPDQSIQATFFNIRPEDIVKVEFFQRK